MRSSKGTPDILLRLNDQGTENRLDIVLTRLLPVADFSWSSSHVITFSSKPFSCLVPAFCQSILAGKRLACIAACALALSIACLPVPAQAGQATAPESQDAEALGDANEASEARRNDTPRLAVMIVVDQMRAGYLEELGNDFTGGLARILRGGTSFRNAWVDHAYTNSFPGHTTAMTGSYPRHHGVTDNVWHEVGPEGPVIRSAASLIGRRDGAAYELGRQTIAEWVVARSPRSQFAAIGSNAATQIYPGQLAGPVFWLSGGEDGYITGPNYAAELPDWVADFNRSRLSELASETWNSTIPQSVVRRIRPDDVGFENNGDATHFPFSAAASGTPPLEWISSSPFSDQATLELAARAIDELELGQDDAPDVLAISLNALDDIGHAYGPYSHEQTDAVLALDRNLEAFMEALDAQVGEDKWVLAITADHGVAPATEGLRMRGSVEGRRISQEQAREVAEAAYAAANGAEGRAAKADAAAGAIETFSFVERAFTEIELAAIEPSPDTIEGLFALSHVAGRVAVHPFYFRDLAIADLGVFVLLKEDIMINWGTAIHGSPYDYDRSVPALFYGPQIASCVRYDRVGTIDVAPTLAAMIGITPSDTIDGRALDITASGCRDGQTEARG